MFNIEVSVSSFWQLARHWKQGNKAKLELSCKDGSLHMQLSAVLGHLDHPHFPHHPPPQPPPPISSPLILKKNKSPSKLRRLEGGRHEVLARAEEAAPKINVKNAASTEYAEAAEKDSYVIVYSAVKANLEKSAEKLFRN